MQVAALLGRHVLCSVVRSTQVVPPQSQGVELCEITFGEHQEPMPLASRAWITQPQLGAMPHMGWPGSRTAPSERQPVAGEIKGMSDCSLVAARR